MTTDALTTMRARALEAFDRLHEGVSAVVFTDFPDYANVGDSAIALGQGAYWAERGIRVEAVYSVQVLPRRVYRSETPVALNGGGSLGGLYPVLSSHRYRLAERLRPDTLLIQEPQSIHFVDGAARAEFRTRMAPRQSLRLGVRDTASLDAVEGLVDTVLSPDAVHLLGPIEAPPPSRPLVVLARTDRESAARRALPAGSVDWLTDPRDLRVRHWWSWRSYRLPILKPLLHDTVDSWFDIAARRFARGVAMLAPGETIVTDRLHAMLLGLQMGRRVLAVDNANGKLSAYASTWFGDLDLPVEFRPTFADALEAVAERT